jgi:hypothetical protein
MMPRVIPIKITIKAKRPIMSLLLVFILFNF